MSAETNEKDLQESLIEVAGPAAKKIRAERGLSAMAQAFTPFMRLVVVIPALYFLFCLILRGAGYDFRPPILWVVLASIAYPLGLLIAIWRRGRARTIQDRSALAAVDDNLDLKDRLSAAHEFLGKKDRTPFMEAAIDDARNQISTAKTAKFTVAAPRPQFKRSQFSWGFAAVVLIALGAMIDVLPLAFLDRQKEQVVASEKAKEVASVNKSKRQKNKREKVDRRDSPTDKQTSGNRKDGGSDEVPEDKKQSKGQVGLGKSAQAQSAGGQSSGEGAASAQAQPTKGGAKKKPKKDAKKSKPSKKKKNKEQGTPPDEKESVASAGRGRGKGASRSPTASDWSSKDQIVTDEDEEFDEDEDVDDDEEESDARGGVQPNLRQRKPPVNRDLNIGFGGGKPPPFANGRGGPGLPKKQRGVAQLVLGVPFPDHITGQPNPGMTKVTQERIEPEASQAKVIDAESRKTRSSPMGRLNHRVLEPWMQDLIREYYSSHAKQNVKE